MSHLLISACLLREINAPLFRKGRFADLVDLRVMDATQWYEVRLVRAASPSTLHMMRVGRSRLVTSDTRQRPDVLGVLSEDLTHWRTSTSALPPPSLRR